MMLPIEPGLELSPADAQHVEDILTRLIESGAYVHPVSKSLVSITPRDLLKHLGWSYSKRYRDARDHVQNKLALARIGERIGQPIHVFISRSQFSVEAGPEKEDVLTEEEKLLIRLGFVRYP